MIPFDKHLAALAVCTIGASTPSLAKEVVAVRFIDSVPVIDVRLSDVTASLFLDTGGQLGISVPERLVSQKTGIRRTGSHFKSMDAAGHLFEVEAVVAPSVRIGEMELGPVKGQIHYDWGLNVGRGAPPDVLNNGALGLAAFYPRNLLFDFANGSLTVFDDGESFEHELEAGWKAVPFAYDARGIVVTFSSDGAAASFSLDSPANATVVRLDAKIFERIGLPCDRRAVHDMCGLTTLRNVRAGAMRLADLPVAVVRMGPVPFDGLLGVDFFRKYKIFVDFGSHTLHLREASPPKP